MRRRAPADRDARRAADARRCGEAGVHGDMISSLRWTAAARCRFARRARRADPAHTAAARQMLRNPIHMAREKTAFDAPQTVPRPARRCIGPRVVAIADNAADKHGGQHDFLHAAATKRRARSITRFARRPERGGPMKRAAPPMARRPAVTRVVRECARPISAIRAGRIAGISHLEKCAVKRAIPGIYDLRRMALDCRLITS